MAGMREIRERIASVSEIMKITNAMYLISSSNLKKAKKRLENTEPYFEKLQSTIHHILLHTPDPCFRVQEILTMPLCNISVRFLYFQQHIRPCCTSVQQHKKHKADPVQMICDTTKTPATNLFPRRCHNSIG